MAPISKFMAITLLCAVGTQACIYEFGNRKDAAKLAGGYYDYSYNGLDWVNRFKTCGGQKQSPIMLPASGAAAMALKAPAGKSKFSYGTLTNPTIVNNGHGLQVTLPANFVSDVQIPIAGDKSKATATSIFSAPKDAKTTLVKASPAQFHFHTRSEHVVNGATYPIEMHIVHFVKKDQLPACGDAGCPVVLGVMLALTDNEAEVKPELHKIMNSLPTTEGNNATIEGQLSLGNLLPADSSYWTYQGSLTTPPCTEGLLWHVMTTPIKISQDLLTKFQEAVGDYSCPDKKKNPRSVAVERNSGPFAAPKADAEGCTKLANGHNFRDVQPLNGRSILYASK